MLEVAQPSDLVVLLVVVRSSQLDMLPKTNPVVERWVKFTEDFDILSDLFVVARAPKGKLEDAKARFSEVVRRLGSTANRR